MKPQIHYTYKITNNKPSDERLYYIGVRTTSKEKAELDTNYQSSSKYLKKALREIGHQNFTKEILNTWATRELADKEESRLHKSLNVSSNPKYYNRHNAGETGFNNVGVVTVFDTIDKINTQVSIEEFYQDDRFISCVKNTVPAINRKTGESTRISKETFNKNKDWEHHTTNQVTVKCAKTSKFKNVTQKEFYKNPELYDGTTKGQVTVIDTRDNTTKNVSKEDYYNKDYFKSIKTGMVTVIDIRTNTKLNVSSTDYRKHDYYVSDKTGTYVVLDTRDNTKKQISLVDYKKHDYYVSTSSKIIDIFNSDGILVMTSLGAFSDFCISHNLSYQKMCESYKAGGVPLYKNISKIGLNRLKRNNKEFQIGWYATLREVG